MYAQVCELVPKHKSWKTVSGVPLHHNAYSFEVFLGIGIRFSQLGWKPLSPSNPPVYGSLRVGVTGKPRIPSLLPKG